MKKKLEVLKISESNIEHFAGQISELHFSVNNRWRDPAYWKWRYLTGPLGQSSLIIAVRGGTVIGKYGLLYMPMLIKGKELKVGLMSGLSIMPKQRSWHCYRSLVMKNIKESQDDGIALRFGCADAKTMKLNQGIRVKDIGKMFFFWGMLNATKILERRSIPFPLSLGGDLIQSFLGLKSKYNILDKIEMRSISVFNDDFDRLWESQNKAGSISIIKKAPYLNWHYVDCPGYKYERIAAYKDNVLIGFIVFCIIDNSCGSFIVEFYADNDDQNILQALLLQALKNLRKKNAGHIRAAFPRKSSQAKALQRVGFKLWGFNLWTPRIILGANSLEDPCPEFDLNAWRFSLGDWVVH